MILIIILHVNSFNKAEVPFLWYKKYTYSLKIICNGALIMITTFTMYFYHSSSNNHPIGCLVLFSLWSFVVQTVRLSNGRSPLLFNESSQVTVSQSSQALQRSWASRHSPPTQHSQYSHSYRPSVQDDDDMLDQEPIRWAPGWTQLLSWS